MPARRWAGARERIADSLPAWPTAQKLPRIVTESLSPATPDQTLENLVLSAPLPRFGLRHLQRPVRLALGGLLAAAGIAYSTALVRAYLQTTSPHSVLPDVRELDRVFFSSHEKPDSQIARLLEAKDLPMNGSGTMRPAFTTQSVGWDSLIEQMSAEERAILLAQREGERLALLDWVRSGPDPEAYEKDDHPLRDAAAVGEVTADFLVADERAADRGEPRRVRIRQLVSDRCVTCHGEDGRNDKARWFPLDTFEKLEPYCRAKTVSASRPKWPIATLFALLPLALLTGPIFCLTSHSRRTRIALTALPLAALVVALGGWLLGRLGSPSIHVLLGASAAAAVGILVQIIASLSELFAREES